MPEYQVDLGGSYLDLGGLVRAEGRPADSLHWYDLAIRTLTPVYEKDPRAVRARLFLRKRHSNRAVAYDELKQYSEAVKDWDKAIELDPQDVNAHSNLGLAFYHQGKFEKAVAASQQAIRLDPKSADAHHNLGNALSDQGKLPEAIDAYRKTVELDPKNAAAHYDLAWRLTVCSDLKLREPKQALVSAKLTVELVPKNRTYWQGLGYAEYRSGNWKAATLAFEKVKELGSPGDSMEWFPLAMAHWQLGDKDTARKIVTAQRFSLLCAGPGKMKA